MMIFYSNHLSGLKFNDANYKLTIYNMKKNSLFNFTFCKQKTKRICFLFQLQVFVISSRPYGQRAVLKYANYTQATPIAGRYTPGAFTNQIQKAFREPRLLVVTDPLTDHQPIIEASYVNIPVIAFCNTDSPLKYIDIAIPCNTKSTHSIGLMWWLLAREVLRIRGQISRVEPWNVVVDLFFYRDPEETEKDEVAAKEPAALPEPHAPEPVDEATDWIEDTPKLPSVAQPEDWNDDEAAPAPKVSSWGGSGAF